MSHEFPASEAMRRAINALQEGNWDQRSHDGARLNALDSIAWSLIGILGHLERMGPPASQAAPEAAPAPTPAPRPRRRHDGVDVSPILPAA